jgi:hypothetical protein
LQREYLYNEVSVFQTPKHGGEVCGDVVHVERSPLATVIICADGIGSGIRANVAAVAAVARLSELLRKEFTLREAVGALARTMTAAMGVDLPFVAFSAARITPDGRAGILTYEAPPPIRVGALRAELLRERTLKLEGATVQASDCRLSSGEGLLLMSDGVTQSGMGRGLAMGWTSEGTCAYVNNLLCDRVARATLPRAVGARAVQLWGGKSHDDCTAVLVDCRPGRVLSLFTGPPIDRSRDDAIVTRFLSAPGLKAVCGATTAKLVQRVHGGKLIVDQSVSSPVAPPAYQLAGIDLVTEGAVTLNQVYNIWDENPAHLESNTGPTRLCRMLHDADRVNIWCGEATNAGNGDITFRQTGVLPRQKIVPLLVDRLRAAGKLVVEEQV